MKILPLLVSVPHAGLWVPPEVESLCILRRHERLDDGDVGAAEIFWSLEPHVAAFVSTDVARAVVDVNRPEDDRRKDGVVKTHTCWDVPVYREPPADTVVRTLLEKYYRPYHRRLTDLAQRGVRLGVDCHTMAAKGPPIGPDPGRDRPAVCLSNANGTCSDDWLKSLRDAFEHAFGQRIAVNDPFRGGHIIRRHAPELPWIQLEISRAPFLSNADKRARVLEALTAWCRACKES